MTKLKLNMSQGYRLILVEFLKAHNVYKICESLWERFEKLLVWVDKRSENLEDKMKNKQLLMELKSLKEVNANLKKTLEEKAKADSLEQVIDVQEDENEEYSTMTSGVKTEPEVAMPNIPNSNPAKKRKIKLPSFQQSSRPPNPLQFR